MIRIYRRPAGTATRPTTIGQRALRALVAVLALLVLTAGTLPVLAQEKGPGRVVVCHRTGGTNEFVRLEVGGPAAKAHEGHDADVIDPPDGVCPSPVPPTATRTAVPPTATNTPVVGEGGLLVVCKVAGPSGAYAFTVTTATTSQTITVSPGSCGLPMGEFPVGTNVTVREAIPAGQRVTAIAVLPPERQVGTADLAGGTVTLRIGSGVTEAHFTNAAG